MKKILYLFFLSFFLSSTNSFAVYSLPTSSNSNGTNNARNSITWAGNVGVLGGIPDRATIYTTVAVGGNIQTAINNCPLGQVVKLASGTHSISSQLYLKSGITLRGNGMGVTIIQPTTAISGSPVRFSSGGTLSSSLVFSTGLAKGSTVIGTSTSHGWAVGDKILLDQLLSSSDSPPVDDGSRTYTDYARNSDRLPGQIVKVIRVISSTSVEIEIPTYWNYNSSRSPQATKINNWMDNAGIEDLTINNANGGSSQTGWGGSLTMHATDNCWLKRVEVIGSYMSAINIRYGYRDTIQFSKWHEGIPATPYQGSPQYDTSRAYGAQLNPVSASLFEANEIYHLDMAFMLVGQCSGNVFGYNYIWGMQYAPSASWQVDTVRAHGGHPMMNLIEGNWTVGTMKFDNTWGTSSHNTFFRNKIRLETSRTSSAQDFNFYPTVWYNNAIGNVLGTAGFETAYSTTAGSSTKAIIGYSSSNQHFFHANWNSVNNTTLYNGSEDQVLPASFYLSSKPSWMGSGTPWPAIGPDVSPMAPAQPAFGDMPWDIQEETDTTPPVLSAGSPSGNLPSGTTSTSVSLSTNEAATCKWSLSSGTSYASMSNTFTTTGNLTHSFTKSGLTNGSSYNTYVRCSDGINVNTSDYLISFTVNNTTPTLSVFDTFTDPNGTALTGHTSETSATWDNNPYAGTGTITIQNNRIYSNQAFGTYYVSNYAPVLNATLSADLYVASNATYAASGLTLRQSITDATMYVFRYKLSEGAWVLEKLVSNVVSNLGSYPATLTVGQTYHMTFVINGSTLNGFVNGVNILTVTDTSISTPGYIGVRLYYGSSTTGYHLDNFELLTSANAYAALTGKGSTGGFGYLSISSSNPVTRSFFTGPFGGTGAGNLPYPVKTTGKIIAETTEGSFGDISTEISFSASIPKYNKKTGRIIIQ